MYVILHQGGGFKGGYGVPIITELVKARRPDVILGVSVGAINGELAAQEDFDLLQDIWLSIDDDQPMDGVKGFLKPALTRGRGIFSLEPMREKLEKHVSLSKLKTVFGCGITLREPMEYRTFLSTQMKRDTRLWDAIQGSAAIAGLMEPVTMRVKGKLRTASDGGHLHTIPLLPDWLRAQVTDVDIILTNPIKHEPQDTTEVDGLLESFEWALQANSATVQDSDLAQYKMLTRERPGITVRVFHPSKSLGSLLKADTVTIRDRFKAGEESLKDPLVWKSKDV